jgi:hypothetical protein
VIIAEAEGAGPAKVAARPAPTSPARRAAAPFPDLGAAWVFAFFDMMVLLTLFVGWFVPVGT